MSTNKTFELNVEDLLETLKSFKDCCDEQEESKEEEDDECCTQTKGGGTISNLEFTGTFDSKREFETGATRNTDEDKLDYEGFLSPLVLKEFAEYMHENREMEDGSLRSGDNWQKGIPIDSYMKSMFRHFMDVWSSHRGLETKEDQITNLCAMMFNVMGMMHEIIKEDEGGVY